MTPEAFQEQVIEVSHDTPVLVDFWAPWCGPCRVLGPILDRLAIEYADRWKLIKVNTDESQDVAGSYGIRGIPAVKLFVNGSVTAEFTGALAEPMVRRWLEEHLPSPERAALTEAETLLESGQTDDATDILRGLLDTDSTNERVRVKLAQAVAFSDPEEAVRLLEHPPADPALSAVANAVQTVALYAMQDPSTLAEGPGHEHFAGALQALQDRDHERAIQELILVLQHDRYYHDDAARNLGVALFALLGSNHAVTQEHRRTFDMWLY